MWRFKSQTKTLDLFLKLFVLKVSVVIRKLKGKLTVSKNSTKSYNFYFSRKNILKNNYNIIIK